MDRKQKIADLRTELERLEAEEKAARPALAAGQVWRRKGMHYIVARHHRNSSDEWVLHAVQIDDGNIWNDREPGFTNMADEFEYVGLARDVLRLVEPEKPAVPQDEPTGEALVVGRKVWYRGGCVTEWKGPALLDRFPRPDSPYFAVIPGQDRVPELWDEVKLYREGVTP